MNRRLSLNMTFLLSLFFLFTQFALGQGEKPNKIQPLNAPKSPPVKNDDETKEIAVFAGGCFWCMQPPFDKLKGRGVLSTQVGYTGGIKDKPTYKEVSSGKTGHLEAIEIVFDPSKITYKALLQTFWDNIDPYDPNGQFCDKGEQYTSAVFYVNDSQKKDFENSVEDLKKNKRLTGGVATVAKPFARFHLRDPGFFNEGDHLSVSDAAF